MQAIAQDRGHGNDFRTVDWPSRRRQSGSKAGESGIHHENCRNRVAWKGSCGNPRRWHNARELVLLDHDFLVVKIIRHGNDKKQNDQGATHRHDLLPIS